jgi:hypothetical protein
LKIELFEFYRATNCEDLGVDLPKEFLVFVEVDLDLVDLLEDLVELVIFGVELLLLVVELAAPLVNGFASSVPRAAPLGIRRRTTRPQFVVSNFDESELQCNAFEIILEMKKNHYLCIKKIISFEPHRKAR